jgi:hypothetical protein
MLKRVACLMDLRENFQSQNTNRTVNVEDFEKGAALVGCARIQGKIC